MDPCESTRFRFQPCALKYSDLSAFYRVPKKSDHLKALYNFYKFCYEPFRSNSIVSSREIQLKLQYFLSSNEYTIIFLYNMTRLVWVLDSTQPMRHPKKFYYIRLLVQIVYRLHRQEGYWSAMFWFVHFCISTLQQLSPLNSSFELVNNIIQLNRFVDILWFWGS